MIQILNKKQLTLYIFITYLKSPSYAQSSRTAPAGGWKSPLFMGYDGVYDTTVWEIFILLKTPDLTVVQ